MEKKEIRYKLDPQEISIQNIKEYISTKIKLSYEEQLWIFRKHPTRRTDDDTKKLIDSNLAMVFKLASVFHLKHRSMSNNNKNSTDVDFMDLFQAGVVGLNRAIVKFDSTLKMNFSTYAYHWISVHISREIKGTVYPLKTQQYAATNVVPMDDTPHSTSTYDDMYGKIEYNEIVEYAKQNLSFLDFTIFKLYFIDEHPVKYIVPAVRRNEFVIRNHLRKIRGIIGEEYAL